MITNALGSSQSILAKASKKLFSPKKASSSKNTLATPRRYDNTDDSKADFSSSLGYKTPFKSVKTHSLREKLSKGREITKVFQSNLFPKDGSTKIKTKNKALLGAEQVETGGRKYYKLLDSTKTQAVNIKICSQNICSSHRLNCLEVNFSRRLALSQELIRKENVCKRVGLETFKIRMTIKSKKRFCEETPKYVPSKRVKKNPDFFKGSLELYDKIRKDYVKFRVYKESELGHGKMVQNTLRKAEIDDDCPTDSEQLELAQKHVQKQLVQAVELQNLFVYCSSSETSSSKTRSSVMTSHTGSSFTTSKSESDNNNKSVESEVLDSSSNAFEKIVKKLSYDVGCNTENSISSHSNNSQLS